ncbi:MAG: hypothetical protein AAF501_07870 [Pseudomonadota bacterium]
MMYTRLPSAFLTAALLLIPAGPADSAARICGKRQAILDELRAKYGETAQSRGFAQGAGVVEIFANNTSGSWTIVVTHPSGMTCLMASGEAFESMPIIASDTPA